MGEMEGTGRKFQLEVGSAIGVMVLIFLAYQLGPFVVLLPSTSLKGIHWTKRARISQVFRD
jgi:hypothetical protein